MNSLNSVIIEGNLISEPILSSRNGKSECRFKIESKRYFSDDTEYEKSVFAVITFDALANTCNTYLKTGSGVRVIGRLKQERWITEFCGKDVCNIIIIAEQIDYRKNKAC